MYSQKIDIEGKLRHSEAQRLKREAKIAAAEEILEDPLSKRSQKLEAQAEIVEANADVEIWELNLQGAKNELATIQQIMAELEPMRKYSHLPLLGATEACQREEWLYELKGRAENFLVTQGSIPHDHLNTMKCHPDFEEELIPHIQQILVGMGSIQSATGGFKLLSKNVSILDDHKQLK